MAAETSSSAEHRALSERKACCGCRRACPGVNPWSHPSGPGASDPGAHLLAPQPLKLTEAQLGEASLPRPQGTESSPGHQNQGEQPFVFGFILSCNFYFLLGRADLQC